MPSDVERHKVTKLSECDAPRHCAYCRHAVSAAIADANSARAVAQRQAGARFGLDTRHPLDSPGWRF